MSDAAPDTQENPMSAQRIEHDAPEQEQPQTGDQPGGEAPQAGQPGQPEPQDAEQVVQPADVDPEGQGRVIELVSRRKGALTLDPEQTDLTKPQRAALVSIGIDVANDPGVVDHVRPFIHMCQIRGLDPFAREAYLIGRGRGNNRKWTMQTGIDGYRKMAASTGRFIRVKKVLWTGADDDPTTWREVLDEDGDIVRRRVWFDQWPASKGHPGAAKVTIEHYDEYDNVTTTSAVANWEFYAPYNDVYEGPSGSRKKVMGPDGKPVRELTDMWQRGGPHMLAKCAEALAHRQAFPATMNGIYVTEEMQRLDNETRAQERDEQRERRQNAYAAARERARGTGAASAPGSAQAPAPSVPVSAADRARHAAAGGQTVTGEAVARERTEPTRAGETAQDIVDAILVEDNERAPQPSASARQTGGGARASAPSSAPQGAPTSAPGAADALALARAEVEWQAEYLGQSVTALARRAVAAARKNYEDFTAEEVLRLAARGRGIVAQQMHARGQGDLGDAIARVAPGEYLDVSALAASVGQAGGQAEATEAPEQRNPLEPHAYADGGAGICWCGDPEDVPQHL